MARILSDDDVAWAFSPDSEILEVDIGEHVTVETLCKYFVWKQKYFVEFYNVSRISFDENTYSDTIGDSEVVDKGTHRNLQVFDLEMLLIFDIDYEYCILAEGSSRL